VLGGVALLLLATSAFGQFTKTTGPITIRDNTTAVPYPSTNSLVSSNVLGTVTKVAVTLNNVNHGYANDVGVLLVGPENRTVVLMRNAGGGRPLSGNITFEADAPGDLPRDTQIVGGQSYKPRDYGAGSFASPAPATPYGSLADFNGLNPNGEWKLYVQDSALLSEGTIESWTLRLWTTPLSHSPPTAIRRTSSSLPRIPQAAPASQSRQLQPCWRLEGNTHF
jgi:subtilisin-like proprotein convertase family protein